ncbi:sensor histidine kinase [Hydrogenibacillus sp. N12]|uniref:sensor histidine kinase n=1 Tax=Hydrogenibacillus sp. N12 TaxID=2866627 RepID=UPI001C7D8801|nr:sensor histidine kinase [Hydrogenibacillus sp. N12]QZA33263.1 sensor histidine kinase [Hydrogenibacillus sp. N12]
MHQKSGAVFRTDRKEWLNHLYTHLLFYFLLIFVLINVNFLIFYFNAERSSSRYIRTLDRLVTLSETADAARTVAADLQRLLIGGQNGSRDRLADDLALLQERIAALDQAIAHPPYPIDWKNHVSLLHSLVEKTEQTVAAFERDDLERYTALYGQVKSISVLTGEQTLMLMAEELHRYRDVFERQSEQKRWLWWMSWTLHGGLLFLIALIALLFAERIARPIRTLATAAASLAEGRFDLPTLRPEGLEETKTLMHAFNHMKEKLQLMFKTMEENAAKDRLLRDMQLKILQQQINPHFLFNTLNMLSKSAFLEGAERTSDLIAAVADLLRYDLDHREEAVPLRDELHHIRNYAEILEARFGREKVSFSFEIDDALTDLLVPKLILQPLVENAYFHGIEGLGRPGEIHVRLYRRNGSAVIEIRDNGRGMEPDSSRRGLGLSNVRDRLALFYDGQAKMELQSRPEAGTTVILVLPLSGNGRGAHAAATDRHRGR